MELIVIHSIWAAVILAGLYLVDKHLKTFLAPKTMQEIQPQVDLSEIKSQIRRIQGQANNHSLLLGMKVD